MRRTWTKAMGAGFSWGQGDLGISRAQPSGLNWVGLGGRLNLNISIRADGDGSPEGQHLALCLLFHDFLFCSLSQRMLETHVPHLAPGRPRLPLEQKTKIFIMTQKSLCIWPLLTPRPSSPPSLPLPYATPATWASSLFLNPPGAIQPQGLCL